VDVHPSLLVDGGLGSATTSYPQVARGSGPYNKEYGRYFPDNKPARTSVEVMLNSPDLLVETAATAGIPD
jgi:enamine deaminase RidA (YjgF/YER057c/UK114 family)